ncbi:hypothetical protein ACEXQB_009825 [Herbiconiux sp. P18]|uniref:hypothetical protein n=1 Tax=Herbiconiux liangxiaofengii TaxID=3342795 RepID=UPI0035BA0538
MGLIENRRGIIGLTPEGEGFLVDQSPTRLASAIARRVRLFAEVLALLVDRQFTIDEVNAELIGAYELGWSTSSNTRQRLTWLEVLGLVEWLGDRKLAATKAGRAIVGSWDQVSPAAVLVEEDQQAVSLPAAPEEISALLEALGSGASSQDARNTYNIWVPSPSADPSKIENMRTSVSAASEPIDKEELLAFIAKRFGLKRSSVESMLPFMRAGGFLQEVRRGRFVATPAAKAWLRSGADIDFVRILHAHMRYVGELIRSASSNVPRSDVYREGALYGMNKEKIRWLIAFMVEAGLLIDTSWSSVQATSAGRHLLDELPLAEPQSVETHVSITGVVGPEQPPQFSDDRSRSRQIAAQLTSSANDPGADGKAQGVALETSIESAFKLLGFRSQRISGSGSTDVLVQWYDYERQLRTAIIDGKSTSSGQVSHTNVSDVAITAHKEKHAADYVAIVAPSFSGETIKDTAVKKGWALITANELGEIVIAAEALGLRPAEVGVLFETPDGLGRVAHMIDTRQRELDMVALVISRLRDEVENDEAVSPRDISLIERRSELAPSIDELISTFSLLDGLSADIVRVVDHTQDAKHATYQIGDVRPAAGRLRALAAALERGLSPSVA